MPHGGTVTLTTRAVAGPGGSPWVELEVGDEGPGMGGRELNVIYVTGYQPEGLVDVGPDTLRGRVLTKPFNQRDLMQAVSESLASITGR